MQIRRRIAMLMFMAATATATADETSLITMSGSTARVLPEGGGSVTFPATFAKAPAVDVVEVTLDGVPVRSGDFSVVADSRGALVLQTKVDAARDAGTYAVVVRARGDGNATQLLTLSVVNPAGELKFGDGAPIRITRTVCFPGVVANVPGAITLNAVSRRTTVTPLQRLWTADLRAADNTVVGRVRATIPGPIEALRNVEVPIEILGDPPLGTSTAALRIAAPQLPTGALEQPIEVISRLSAWWLLVIILAGILAGYLVRETLEKRRMRAEALLVAEAQRTELQEHMRETADAEDVTALEEVLGVLESAMANSALTSDEIRVAATTAKKDATAIVENANERRAEAAIRIAELQAKIGVPDQHAAPVANLIREISGLLDEQLQALSAGESRSVIESVKMIDDQFTSELESRLIGWSAEVREALVRIGSWPNVPTVDAGVAAARVVHDHLDTAADRPSALKTARRLSITLRADLFGAGRRALLQTAETVAQDADDPLAAQNIRKLAAIVAGSLGEPSGDDLRTLVDSMVALCTAVDEAQGTLPHEETDLGDEANRRIRETTEIPLARGGVDEPPVARLAMKGLPVVGRTVSFRITSAGPRPLPRIRRATWTINGASVAGNGPTLIYRPAQAQMLNVRAEVEFSDGSRTAAELPVEITTPPRLPSAAQLLGTRRGAEAIQTTVAGVVIALAGVLMFRSAFVGTLDDLAVSFLWGFTSDIGLARVREFALPLVQRRVGG